MPLLRLSPYHSFSGTSSNFVTTPKLTLKLSQPRCRRKTKKKLSLTKKGTASVWCGKRKLRLAPQASIEIRKDGTVRITSRTYGSEISPFIGLGIDAQARGRGALGVNLFYWQRYEFGGGLTVGAGASAPIRAFVHASYNVWNNTHMSAGVDNHKTPFAMLSVNF